MVKWLVLSLTISHVGALSALFRRREYRAHVEIALNEVIDDLLTNWMVVRREHDAYHYAYSRCAFLMKQVVHGRRRVVCSSIAKDYEYWLGSLSTYSDHLEARPCDQEVDRERQKLVRSVGLLDYRMRSRVGRFAATLISEFPARCNNFVNGSQDEASRFMRFQRFAHETIINMIEVGTMYNHYQHEFHIFGSALWKAAEQLDLFHTSLASALGMIKVIEDVEETYHCISRTDVLMRKYFFLVAEIVDSGTPPRKNVVMEMVRDDIATAIACPHWIPDPMKNVAENISQYFDLVVARKKTLGFVEAIRDD